MEHVTIVRRHVNPHVSVDGCLTHGIGIGMCRIHKMERYSPRHRLPGETLVGFPRMGF